MRIFTYCLCFLVAILLLLWLSDNTKFLFNAIGRDMTLTGRITLWEEVLIMIKKRPLLGYGFNAFWTGNTESIQEAIKWPTLHSRLGHSHNGYLDIWADLGLLGLLIYITGLLQSFRNAVINVRFTSNSEAFWPLIYLIFMAVQAAVESPLVHNKNIIWILYVSVAISPYTNNIFLFRQSPERFRPQCVINKPLVY